MKHFFPPFDLYMGHNKSQFSRNLSTFDFKFNHTYLLKFWAQQSLSLLQNIFQLELGSPEYSIKLMNQVIAGAPLISFHYIHSNCKKNLVLTYMRVSNFGQNMGYKMALRLICRLPFT